MTHFILLFMNNHSQKEIFWQKNVEFTGLHLSYLPVRWVSCILFFSSGLILALPWQWFPWQWICLTYHLIYSCNKHTQNILLSAQYAVSFGEFYIAKTFGKWHQTVRKRCCIGGLGFLLDKILLRTGLFNKTMASYIYEKGWSPLRKVSILPSILIWRKEWLFWHNLLNYHQG